MSSDLIPQTNPSLSNNEAYRTARSESWNEAWASTSNQNIRLRQWDTRLCWLFGSAKHSLEQVSGATYRHWMPGQLKPVSPVGNEFQLLARANLERQ